MEKWWNECVFIAYISEKLKAHPKQKASHSCSRIKIRDCTSYSFIQENKIEPLLLVKMENCFLTHSSLSTPIIAVGINFFWFRVLTTRPSSKPTPPPPVHNT